MTYLFKNNKYKKWYYDIIKNANLKLQHRLQNTNEYYENHHIIPKSLGGNNAKYNLVKLTAREHFLVHILLVKMVQDKDVYKMVCAVVRFSTKVNNSHQYELLRRYASKYSMGKYNKSYNKIWIHNMITKNIKYVDKTEYDLLDKNIYVKGLPFQRGGHFNTMWINDGLQESLVDKNTIIPKGWKKGRINFGDNEHMRKMGYLRHTAEKDKEHSEKLKGRVQIFNKKLHKSKRIHKKDLNQFLNNGWIVKGCPTSLSKEIEIENIIYESLGEAHRILNIPHNTISYRIRSLNDRWEKWKYTNQNN